MINEVQLSEICTKITDGSHNPPKGTDEGMLMLSSRNITNNGLELSEVRYITEEEFELENRRTDVSTGDILITIVGTVGRVLVTKGSFPKFTLQRSVGVLKPKHDIIFSEYFGYALKSETLQRKLQERAKGVAQKGIYLNDLKKLKIPLPPLATQKKIAAILDEADKLRQLNKQLIEKYNALTQSLFLDMFGDPVTNPKGWEKVKLNSICSFDKQSILPEDIEKGTAYLGLECIEKETGEIKEIFRVQEGEIKSNKFCFNSDYVLYGKLRPYLNKVALPNFDGICSTDIIPLRPLNNKTNKYFISKVMKDRGFVAFAHERSSGANLPRISPKEIEKYPTINPPIELQNLFATRIQAIEKQKEQAQQALDKSEELFNSLLQKAFKGELVEQD